MKSEGLPSPKTGFSPMAHTSKVAATELGEEDLSSLWVCTVLRENKYSNPSFSDHASSPHHAAPAKASLIHN